jgi:multidrug efflux pump subunit AcrA (membrane-fusion protein)
MGAGLIAVAAARAAEGEAAAPETAANVLVTQAKRDCFSALVRVTGFLLPAQQAVVTLGLDGYRVSEIFAQEGERVREGQQLARLQRIGQPMPGQQEMPASIVLKAPAGGRIEKSTAQIGDVTTTRPDAQPLFRIAGDEVEMEAEVPSLYLAEIAPKQMVRIETPTGEVLGQVKRVSPVVDKITQLGHVRAILAPDSNLRSGAFARATIEAGQSCGVSVPRSAVNYGTGGTTVQVVRAQTVETRRVRIGLVSDHDAEIEEGVRVGEVVVAHAGTSLRDGDLVTPTFIDASDRSERH